jgi:hypothetical protein
VDARRRCPRGERGIAHIERVRERRNAARSSVRGSLLAPARRRLWERPAFLPRLRCRWPCSGCQRSGVSLEAAVVGHAVAGALPRRANSNLPERRPRQGHRLRAPYPFHASDGSITPRSRKGWMEDMGGGAGGSKFVQANCKQLPTQLIVTLLKSGSQA